MRTTAITRPVLLTALSCMMGCEDTARGVGQDAEDAEQRLEESVPVAEAEVEQEVAEFRRNSRTALDAMNVRLERLERATENATDQANVETRQELDDLRRKRAELAARIERAEARTAAEWQATKRQFDKDLAELGRDIDRALDTTPEKPEEALR